MTKKDKSGTFDQDVLNAIHQFAMKLSKRYDIARLILFGSRARGDHHSESDIDLAIFLNTELSDFVKIKMDMVDDAYDIFLETGCYIQPLPIGNETDTAINKYVNAALLNNIRVEGIEIDPTYLHQGVLI